jgi:hypothetical protein
MPSLRYTDVSWKCAGHAEIHHLGEHVEARAFGKSCATETLISSFRHMWEKFLPLPVTSDMEAPSSVRTAIQRLAHVALRFPSADEPSDGEKAEGPAILKLRRAE